VRAPTRIAALDASPWIKHTARVLHASFPAPWVVGDNFNNALAEFVIGRYKTARSRRAPMPTNAASPRRARHPARMVDRR